MLGSLISGNFSLLSAKKPIGDFLEN
jgi:hypothetical protein